ncbi:MAG: diguanylate cyclase [Desulfosarcinaceae bacterium]|nr:diguanylate cyclase [Desulfosarcinaceae bacterium]
MLSAFSITIIPPILILVVALGLAGLAVLRGGMQRENLLFALVCTWYALLAPLFISHHLISDLDRILSLERKIHFLYVFLPLLQVLFFHQILGIRRPYLILALALFGAVMAPLTQTDLYYTGLHRYSWGYIGKGGPAFLVFGAAGFVTLGYCLWCFWQALKQTVNPVLRLKYQYMFLAFCITGVLTLMNIPAINGIDLYPAGNFSFIPMGILGYGLLKHRLLDWRSMFHKTILWALTSSLVVVPNLLLWIGCERWVRALPFGGQFALFMLWIVLNHLYFIHIQPWIDQRFNRAHYHLRKAEGRLFEQFQILKTSEAVVAEVVQQVRAHLHLVGVQLVPYQGDPPSESATHGDNFGHMARYLQTHTGMLDRPLVQTHPMYAESRGLILSLMDRLEAEFLQPLVSHGELVAVLVVPRQSDGRRLGPNEIHFIEQVARTASVALSNSVMYERITHLKDDLEQAQVAMEKAVIQANEMASKSEVANYVLAKEVEERKKAEAALRASEEQYRLIAENTSDIIWTMDLDTNFTYISPSVAQMRGISAVEAMQGHFSEVLTPESLEKGMELLSRVLANEAAGEHPRNASEILEVEMYRHDGTTFWAEITMSFIRDDDGVATGIMGITRDITKRKAAEQNLVYLAYHDALTGLANRKAFVEKLDQETTYAKRYKTALVVMLLDLDGFKSVNDTHGHELGDHLLVSVSQRLTDTLRETDFIARLGGDEFTIILANPENNDATQVALRIQQMLGKPYKINDITIDKVGASIGIAQYPTDGEDTTSLIRSADTAMYQAKKAKCGYAYHTALIPPPVVAIG